MQPNPLRRFVHVQLKTRVWIFEPDWLNFREVYPASGSISINVISDSVIDIGLRAFNQVFWKH